MLSAVNYIEARYEKPAKFDEDFMNKLLSSKFEHWRYEDEYRMFVDLESIERVNGLYFQKFDSTLRLTDIFIGHSASVDKEKVLDFVGENELSIRIVKVRPAFKSFKIVVDQRSA